MQMKWILCQVVSPDKQVVGGTGDFHTMAFSENTHRSRVIEAQPTCECVCLFLHLYLVCHRLIGGVTWLLQLQVEVRDWSGCKRWLVPALFKPQLPAVCLICVLLVSVFLLESSVLLYFWLDFVLATFQPFFLVCFKKKMEREVFHFNSNFFCLSPRALVSLMSCSSSFAQEEVGVNFVHVFVLPKTIIFIGTWSRCV